MPVITNVNIKELPVLEEIKNGDLLLVETDKGTQTIDFANFVVGPDNVNFYNEVISLSSGIITTNNSLQTTTRSISTSIQDYVNAKAASMSATVVSQYSKIFYQSGQLTFPVGATVSNSVVITLPIVGMTIGPENVNLTFNSTVVPALTGLLINCFPSVNGNTPFYSLQANLTSPSMVEVAVNYNVIKLY
ncbi:MAG: hypothetical protein EBU90_03315 [Proteobacteria bacterium]|nr:hypothetical protein [Pseudomonadota bacterium]NBP13356.1 hypothetical protein [bacterium]